MKHTYTDKVYYADTDSYGVVWHGSYIRWMEKGRVLFCDELGLDLVDLKEADVAIPVANLNIRYKSSAKINEVYKVTTTVSKITPLAVTFRQVTSNAETGQVYTDAEVVVVAVNNSGKLYRRLPEKLTKIFNEDIICND
ncbi:MAG: acyl-CoA thioesterase [Cyanobacteria bacterium RUI128]|nr:acyl-CoA thioesterase [Cyanobacteria bacterium RUI128]